MAAGFRRGDGGPAEPRGETVLVATDEFARRAHVSEYESGDILSCGAGSVFLGIL
jgi:hypothetical protein